MNHLLKKRLCIMLTACLLLGLSACGKGNDADHNSTDGETIKNEASQPEKKTEADSTEYSLPPRPEEAYARILWAEENYCAFVVFDAFPQRGVVNVDMTHLEHVDGDTTYYAYARSVYDGVTRENGIWYLCMSLDGFDDVQDYSKFNIEITDTATGHERITNLTDLEMITPEEYETLGLFSMDGHPVIAPPFGIYEANDCFGLRANFYIFGKDGIEAENYTAEQFQFYSGDGTPLAEQFPDNTFTVDIASREAYINDYEVTALFELASGQSVEEMAEQLRACAPYMVYTGANGDTWTAPLIQEEE